MLDEGLLKNFIDGMYEVIYNIKSYDPDVLIFPIRGAVAINDILRILDQDVLPSRQIEYLYSSSSIYKVNDVIRESTMNLLREYHVPNEKLKIMTIDEVVSGHSLARESKYMWMGLLDYVNYLYNNHNLDKGKTLNEIEFQSVAILDLRHKKSGKPYQKGYLKMLEQNLVVPVGVNENIVMDKPQYCPVKLKRKDLHTYYPEMNKFEITLDYLELLRHIASYVGQDLKLISLQNPEAVVHSERLVPDKYKSPKELVNPEKS